MKDKTTARSAQWRQGQSILPIVQKPVSLNNLCGEVNGMAAKEKVVLRGDSEGVAHEGSGVDDQGASHGSGDTIRKKGNSRSAPTRGLFEEAQRKLGEGPGAWPLYIRGVFMIEVKGKRGHVQGTEEHTSQGPSGYP